MKTRLDTAETIEKDWAENPRWQNVQRDYTGSDVVRLKGSVQIEYTLARLGAEKLWHRVNTEDFVPTLGALTGGVFLSVQISVLLETRMSAKCLSNAFFLTAVTVLSFVRKSTCLPPFDSFLKSWHRG